MMKPKASARVSQDANFEHPNEGGSYIRNADGSLSRVEGPGGDAPADPAETSADTHEAGPAIPAAAIPSADSQEG